MHTEKKYSSPIAIIVNVHGEGLTLIPTLRSAVAAKKECQSQGIGCEIHIIGISTEKRIQSIIEKYLFSNDCNSYFNADRNTDLSSFIYQKIDAEYYCFFNAGDVVQKEWPIKAYLYAKTKNNKNCIFHTEIFAEFGATHRAKIQLTSHDPIFHPIHSILADHFSHNIFVHAEVLINAPEFLREKPESGKFETWHWSCETLAAGIARDVVPNTVYFGRVENSALNRNAIQKTASQKNSILENSSLTRSYESFSGIGRNTESGNLEMENNITYSDNFPNWLYHETKKAAIYEYDIFELLKLASNLKCETPPISMAAGYLFVLAERLGKSNFTVLAIDCEKIVQSEIGTLELGIRHAAKDNKLLVLCSERLANRKIFREDNNVIFFNLKAAFCQVRSIESINIALAATISNFSPRAIINVNFDIIDNFCGYYKDLVKSYNIPTARYLLSDLEDIHVGFDDRRVLAEINQAKYYYSHLAAVTKSSFDYLQSLYAICNIEILLTSSRLSYISEFISQVRKTASPAEESQNFVPFLPLIEHSTDIQVSCILNLHCEGKIVIPTLRSISRMIDRSQQQGIMCELVIVLDRADKKTCDFIQSARSKILNFIPVLVLEVDNGDLGKSRRDGVANSSGDYIAFLDGDDLYSKNWIVDAHQMAQADPNRDETIYHPELNVYFGEHHRTFWHPDAAKLDPVGRSGLLLENLWTSLSFGLRKLYEANPVHDNGLDKGFGYEDWHWNMDTTAKEIKHRPVHQTIHFIRLKPTGSLNNNSSSRSVIVRPSNFANSLLFKNEKSPS
jgi:hypothetical protein